MGGQVLGADAVLGFEFPGHVRALLDDTLVIGERQVGLVLVLGRDPTVADQETFQVPLGGGLPVTVEDMLCDVGNVLAGV